MKTIAENGLIDLGVKSRFDVYVSWKDGPGGVHSKGTLGEAIEEAEALARRGFGKPGKEIRIDHIRTESWRYEP